MTQTIVVLGSYAPSLVNFRGPLIASMVASGRRVIAAAPDYDDSTVKAVEALGAEPLTLEGQRQGMNPFADLAFQKMLTEQFRAIRPDLVLAYTAKPIVWGAPAARAAGVKSFGAIITGLGFAFTDGGGWKRRVARAALTLLYRRALPMCDSIMFQNPDDRAMFARLGLLRDPAKVQIINGSGVDLDHFTAQPPPAQTKAFLMIARLLGDKGVREYCRAAALVKQRHPDVAARLVGYMDLSPDGLTQVELDQWTAQGVDYLGPSNDVRPALAAADVYVLPSYREGTPRSVLEAMATGRAVITTDAPGCRETVIDGENGFLVPVRDAEALAAAMLRFVDEPSLAGEMGAASRRIAQARYDVHKVNAAIMTNLGLD